MLEKRLLSKKIFEATDLTMPEFCLKYLACNYKAFQYRIREGRCNPNEIIFISWFLGETVETLFGKPFTSLMMEQGEEKVSEDLVQRFSQAPEQDRARLLGLLGHGVALGASTPEISPGVPTPEAGPHNGAGGPVVVLPGFTVTPKDKRVRAVTDKAQKKAPPIAEVAPKKTDPFDILQDFKISR